jgi:hypothetical protein
MYIKIKDVSASITKIDVVLMVIMTKVFKKQEQEALEIGIN